MADGIPARVVLAGQFSPRAAQYHQLADGTVLVATYLAVSSDEDGTTYKLEKIEVAK